MIKALAVLLLVFSLPAFAALEVAGVKFEDSAKVGAGDTVINGAGLRKKVFFKVYAVALYLPQKQTAAADVLAAKGAKRIAIVTLRDLTAQEFVERPARRPQQEPRRSGAESPASRASTSSAPAC